MPTPLPRCTLAAIATPENLLQAAAKARKGKSRRPDVEDWWQRRESAVLRLSRELVDGTWQPSGYRLFEIREPKRRMIAAAPFEDRVVHHALCNLMQPVLERRFIARSFSCQVGKGTTAARECCRQLVNRHRYVLKCDVRKFFDSIPHDILLEKLAARLRCPGVLELCRRIIHSYSAQTAQRTGLTTFQAPLASASGYGLPIGNLTSQLWGNFILDAMDHWITEDQRHGAYLRYTDDFLLFADAPEQLWEMRAGIQEKLAEMRLHLAEPKSRLLTTAEGVPFCGFLFSPGQRPRVPGSTKRRFLVRRQRLYKMRAMQSLSDTVRAWYAFAAEGNTHGLTLAWSRPRECCGLSSLHSLKVHSPERSAVGRRSFRQVTPPCRLESPASL